MPEYEWIKEFPGAITVCDREGIILAMNEKAIKTFEKEDLALVPERSAGTEGGKNLLGSNVLNCHPEPARSKLQKLLETGASNCYTIEKQGVKKLIYQSPWYREGEYMGLVEFSLEIPDVMPHFIRK